MSNRKKIHNDEKDEKWFEICSSPDIKDYQEILKILIRLNNSKSELVEFLKKFSVAPTRLIRVILRKEEKTDNYNVNLFLLNENFCYIHVDGFIQERKEKLEQGITEHRVFEITSLTDLYKRAKRLGEVKHE